MELTRALAERLPGSRMRPNAYGGVTLVFEHDGGWLDARVREGPEIEVFVRTLDAPGVELTIECNDRSVTLSPRLVDAWTLRAHNVGPTPEEIERAAADLGASRCVSDLRIRRSDDPIAALWIDVPAEQALLEGVWCARNSSALMHVLQLQSLRYHVRDGEVMLGRRGNELDPLHRGFLAAASLAARPHRIARAWLDVARGLGGTTTADRWDLADRGGEFAVTFDRSPAAVRIDNLRRVPGDDDDHHGLYTRARARRVAAHGDHWALWERALPREHRPHPARGLHPVIHPTLDAVATDPARLLARLRPHTDLLAAAAPSSVATIGDSVELWWPGLVQDPARVGPAIELVSRLAGEVDAPSGPYR